MASQSQQSTPGNYPLQAQCPPAGTFNVYIVMTGTLVAGVDTARVIDFLVEAGDASKLRRRSNFKRVNLIGGAS